MKFIGGTRHSQDAPEWVRALVIAGQREVDIEEHTSGGAEPPTPQRIERYVVRTWTAVDGRRFKFLAIAGKGRHYIELMAAPLLSTYGRGRWR